MLSKQEGKIKDNATKYPSFCQTSAVKFSSTTDRLVPREQSSLSRMGHVEPTTAAPRLSWKSPSGTWRPGESAGSSGLPKE